MVEVLSPSTRRIDLVRKMALYGTSGIREYRIVDFENRSVRVVSFRDGTPVDVIRTTGKVESQVLVGIDIDIPDLFEGIPGLEKSAIL